MPAGAHEVQASNREQHRPVQQAAPLGEPGGVIRAEHEGEQVSELVQVLAGSGDDARP